MLSQQLQLVQPTVFRFLVAYVCPDYLLVAPDRRYEYPLAQKFCPTKFRLRSPYTRARWIALLPLMKPTTCDTAYFGGIRNIMCT